MENYFSIHKNKKPKKLKYSKPYTSLEYKVMRDLNDFFTKASTEFINQLNETK